VASAKLFSFRRRISATLRRMKWLLRILSFIVILVVLVLAIGYSIPAHHKLTRTIDLKQTPDAVFAALADVQKMPEWNHNLEKVEILPPVDGKETTKQTLKGGMTMTIVTAESSPPNHLVRAMNDAGGPMVGSWTYEISAAPDGSQVVLIEEATFQNPVFRLMVKIFGPTKHMDEHLVDLGKHFGETVTPR
jgi:uncharacterized protein YndB with AHSA1/START domain